MGKLPPLPDEVWADPGRYGWYFREKMPDSVAKYVRADLSSPLGAVVKPLEWVVHLNGWLSAETIGGEFWVQKGLSTSECQKRHNARILAALEPPTHAALLAHALRLPEVAALVLAAKYFADWDGCWPGNISLGLANDHICAALSALEARHDTARTGD